MSRDQIILDASDERYLPGTVLGKHTSGANSGHWGRFDPADATGLQVAKGILFAGRNASTGTQRAVAHTRNCRVNGKKLTWIDGVTDNQKATAIAALMGNNTDGTGGVQVGF